jgi:hypothetical protein
MPMITFLPNDPRACDVLPSRVQTPRPDVPAGRAGVVCLDLPRARRYEIGSPGFLAWQCREAALATLEAAAGLGLSPRRWPRAWPDPAVLILRPDAGADLNAFYDGRALSFFHFDHPDGTRTNTAASVDVVAHETGHALLDSLRPDLWDIASVEVAAFHEAFADCMALLVALADAPTRVYLLPRLGEPNAVESIAEDLAAGIRLSLGPAHPAAEPRHAAAAPRWQMPVSLPLQGPPGVLTSEVHSFSRVFSGAFYALVRGLFESTPAPRRGESTLAEAARVAGRLLLEAVTVASPSVRFFLTVARALIWADDRLYDGAHRQAIRDALASHGLDPLCGPGAEVPHVPSVVSGGGPPPSALHAVDLSGLDPRLAGCLAEVAVPLPTRGVVVFEADTAAAEVRSFVAGLLAHEQIAFHVGPGKGVSPRLEALGSDRPAPLSRPTHVVRRRHDGRSVLRRVGFA